MNENKSGCGGVFAIVVVIVLIIAMIGSCSGNSSSTGTKSSGGSSAKHSCYVCGDNASLKYGSHYYCATHYAMVKTVVEAD